MTDRHEEDDIQCFRSHDKNNHSNTDRRCYSANNSSSACSVRCNEGPRFETIGMIFFLYQDCHKGGSNFQTREALWHDTSIWVLLLLIDSEVRYQFHSPTIDPVECLCLQAADAVFIWLYSQLWDLLGCLRNRRCYISLIVLTWTHEFDSDTNVNSIKLDSDTSTRPVTADSNSNVYIASASSSFVVSSSLLSSIPFESTICSFRSSLWIDIDICFK